MRRISPIIIFLVLTLLSACGSNAPAAPASEAPVAAEQTTTESAASAGESGEEAAVIEKTITFDTRYEETFTANQTTALYRFDAPGGSIIAITVGRPATELMPVLLTLNTAAGMPIASQALLPGATGDVELRRMLSDEEGGTYTLQVVAGPTDLNFTVNLTDQNDAGSGGDAGANLAGAPMIEVGGSLSGMLGDNDQLDVYRFSVPGGAALNISISSDAANAGSLLFELLRNGEVITYEYVDPSGSKAINQVLNDADAGEYGLRVTGSGIYSFQIGSQTQQDGGGEGDAGSSQTDARPIALDTPLRGSLGNNDSQDFYRFEAAPGALIEVNLVNDAGSAETVLLELYINGEVRNYVYGEIGSENTISYQLNNEESGEYFIALSSGSATYGFTVRAGVANEGDGTGDAGAADSDAAAFSRGNAYQGRLADSDTADRYRLALDSAGTLTVQADVSADSAYSILVEILFNGEVLNYMYVDIGSSGSISVDSAGPGEYFIAVSGGPAQYTLQAN